MTPPRRARATFLLLAFAILGPLMPTASAAAESLDRQQFGMTAHFMWHDADQAVVELDRMRAAGFTVARFDLGWRWVEPAGKGAYDAAVLAKLDGILREADARGIATIITVIETPAWARPAGTSLFYPPTRSQDYADVMRMLAGRYAARPNMVWEVWNEPNLVEFWESGPDAGQYTALLRDAYGAIKSVDPDATVLGGSLAFNNLDYLEAMYAAGVAGSFDGLSIHPYTAGRSPDDASDTYFSLRHTLEQMKGLMVAHGEHDKLLWVTEFGWSTDDVSDAVRAGYLRDAVAILRDYPYVVAACAYTIHQPDYPAYGLLAADGAETASWRAYVEAAAREAAAR